MKLPTKTWVFERLIYDSAVPLFCFKRLHYVLTIHEELETFIDSYP